MYPDLRDLVGLEEVELPEFSMIQEDSEAVVSQGAVKPDFSFDAGMLVTRDFNRDEWGFTCDRQFNPPSSEVAEAPLK